MKKFKVAFVAVVLSFLTIGVFAGREKFADYILYYDNSGSGSYVQITDAFTVLNNMSTTGNNNVSISGAASKGLFVSTDGGATKQRVKTSSF
ncbi:MAG: hypothetical protein M9904_14460 [Chitinophagaceae bacterium]|nr:hypothetical protein [Chitinophagaceae bacterium]MCO5241249.1 hypothetical protein [Chitinophagaceae bacterium]